MSSGYAVVVGGANVDIGGIPYGPLVQGDSVPGRVRLAAGGVGRNIAHNMRLLGTDVVLLTAVGTDDHAKVIEEACFRAGVVINHARRIAGVPTAVYLYLCGNDHDMAFAVNDMEICNYITPAYLAEHIDILSGARMIVADANLPEDTLSYLAMQRITPLFVDPVSVTKAQKLLPVLSGIHTLKPNRAEAEALTGVRITDEASLQHAADVLLAAGVKRVFISLGMDGVYATDGMQAHHVTPERFIVQNTTGAGDAMTAALAWSFMEGMGLQQSAGCSLVAAMIASESEETVNLALSREEIFRRLAPAEMPVEMSAQPMDENTCGDAGNSGNS